MVDGVESQSGCYRERRAVGGGCLDLGSMKRESQQDNNAGLTFTLSGGSDVGDLLCHGPIR